MLYFSTESCFGISLVSGESFWRCLPFDIVTMLANGECPEGCNIVRPHAGTYCRRAFCSKRDRDRERSPREGRLFITPSLAKGEDWGRWQDGAKNKN